MYLISPFTLSYNSATSRKGFLVRIRTGFTLGLCMSLPLPTFADFRYDETSKITGGSIVNMTKFAGAFSKQARQITDPVNSTILVKGNRMAHINQEITEIVDLDKETIIKIDPRHLQLQEFH